MVFQENALHTDVEQRDILDYTDNVICAAERVIDSLSRSIEKAKCQLKYGEEPVEYLFESPLELLAETCGDLLSSLRRNTIRLHQAVQFSPCFARETSPDDRVFSEHGTSVSMENSVIVRLENDGIFIRMPMLWSTNYRMRNNKTRMEALAERDDVFASAVRQGILTAPNYDHFDTSRYIEKTVIFLYVYPISERYGALAADNMNHLTKGVLDAATMVLPGGDSPFSCSVFCSATRSDEVESGTYMTILPGRDSIMSSENILRFWREEQEKMPKT